MIDLHLHTTASDGLLPPRDLVARAAAAGLSTIAVTDHDTVGGLADARATAAGLGVDLVNGIEITAVEGTRDVHILGYFFDPSSHALVAFLDAQRADRIRRVRDIAARLRDLGYPVDVVPLIESAESNAGRSIGRPQIADALTAAGFTTDRRDAFDRLLGNDGPAYVPRCGAPPEEVVRIVRAAGGVTSLAHPGLLRDDALIPRLASAGLPSIEVRHSDHDEATEARYREIAAALNLAVSGGSDFHGDVGHRRSMLGTGMMTDRELDALKARIP